MRILDLNGTWLLRDAEHQAGEQLGFHGPELDEGEWLRTSVPGDIHPTLIEAGRIPEPYYGLNLHQCGWTAHREWWYRRRFTRPAEGLPGRVELVFDGIDTYGTIWLNGVRLGATDNSFRPWRFDVTDLLQDGENLLVVRVGATVKILEAEDTSRYVACFYVPRILARKAQCQFSWDWSPNLPSLGLWRQVRLEAPGPGCIEDVHVRTRISGDLRFEITFSEELERDAIQRDSADWRYVVEIDRGAGCETLRREQPCTGRRNLLNVRMADPRLWWPNGYGAAHLYPYTVRLLRDGREIHAWHGRFGIREVELIQEALAADAQSFRFRVNGVDVFCKGANWVPADCFPATVTRARYAHLIRLAREAHFNMLRVWGGGIYESDAFYDLCDEQGIMIWQDLMFACADIPDDRPDFVAGVIPEFQYQVRRLRRHPCLAHWCGGNEKTGDFARMVSYGDTITRIVGRGAVMDLHPELAYTPSSPCSLTDIGQDPSSGDTHGGCYEHAYRDSMRNLRKHVAGLQAVFHSEFGMHGPCQMRSLRKFIPPDRLWPLNDVWEEHVQDNPYNTIPETFVRMQEKAATELFHHPDSAAEFVKVAGTLHAEIIRAEFEHHRIRKWYNAGAMLWMLNDTWPCASWSIIDYYGLPKQVYYASKRACAPLLVALQPIENGHEVYLVHDGPQSLRGQLTVEEQTVNGERGYSRTIEVTAPANGSDRVAVVADDELEGLPNACLYARFTTPETQVSTTFFHRLWHDIEWPEPELEVQPGPCRVTATGEWAARIDLRTKRFARCVNLLTAEDVEAYFSDNFFDMTPGECRSIEVRCPRAFDPTAVHVNHWLTTWDD